LHDPLAAAKYLADWSTPLLLQATVARFIEDGLFARHLRRMRGVYEARHRAVVDGVQRTLAGVLDVVPASAGLHVTALATTFTVPEIEGWVRRASTNGVECSPLALSAAGEGKLAGLVLGYGAIATERIADGIAALRSALPT
jgi:GntR family transcriptional regulator/MocR family aminotransferase